MCVEKFISNVILSYTTKEPKNKDVLNSIVCVAM